MLDHGTFTVSLGLGGKGLPRSKRQETEGTPASRESYEEFFDSRQVPGTPHSRRGREDPVVGGVQADEIQERAPSRVRLVGGQRAADVSAL